MSLTNLQLWALIGAFLSTANSAVWDPCGRPCDRANISTLTRAAAETCGTCFRAACAFSLWSSTSPRRRSTPWRCICACLYVYMHFLFFKRTDTSIESENKDFLSRIGRPWLIYKFVHPHSNSEITYHSIIKSQQTLRPRKNLSSPRYARAWGRLTAWFLSRDCRPLISRASLCPHTWQRLLLGSRPKNDHYKGRW